MSPKPRRLAVAPAGRRGVATRSVGGFDVLALVDANAGHRAPAATVRPGVTLQQTCNRGPDDGEVPDGRPLETLTMIRHVRRALVLAAGISGLLVLSSHAANAGMSLNHCEPLRRR